MAVEPPIADVVAGREPGVGSRPRLGWLEGPVRFATAEDLVAALTPAVPVLALRPHAVERAGRWFLQHFPGDVAYACKANDSTRVLALLHRVGIRHLDVASLAEIETGLGLPGAVLHLMNPVKSRATIRLAYHKAGVRSFAFDSLDELAKIVAETDRADDLRLFLRLAVPAAPDAGVPLERKFGAAGAGAVELLRAARVVAAELGVAFHVGSQAGSPGAWAVALAEVDRLIRQAGVPVDVVDVGGGFPAAYRPPVRGLAPFVGAIGQAASDLPGVADGRCRLMCEPGRALVAEGESLIVQVLARRGRELFLDDGAFGVLYDATHHGLPFPARLVGGGAGGPLEAFSCWGPSCTSEDRMPGPFWLPDSVREGDHLEIGLVGAYGRVLATRFNGFGSYREAVLDDDPFPSMYHEISTHPAARGERVA